MTFRQFGQRELEAFRQGRDAPSRSDAVWRHYTYLEPLSPGESKAIGSTLLGLAVPEGATHMLLKVTTASIRCWETEGRDTPSTTAGLEFEEGTFIQWLDERLDYKRRMLGLRMIRGTSSNAQIDVQYYQRRQGHEGMVG